MRKINYIRPSSLQDALRAMQTPDAEAAAPEATIGAQGETGAAGPAAGNAAVLAGGTDLLGTLREGILPDSPARLVSLRDSGLRYIREE